MEKRKSNTPYRYKAKKVFILIGVFIASLLFLTMAHHYNDFLGMGKQSWSQILNDLWLYSIGALIITVGVYLKHF